MLFLCCSPAFACPWAPTPTLTHLVLAHPCLLSHGDAQHHWADPESACLGNAVEWRETKLLELGFSLPMRLIQNMYYIFIYMYLFGCQVPGQGLHFRNFQKAPLFPLTWAAPLSSLSVTAEPTIDTQDNPRHWPYVLNIAIRCLKQAVWILPLICAHVPSPLFFYYLL